MQSLKHEGHVRKVAVAVVVVVIIIIIMIIIIIIIIMIIIIIIIIIKNYKCNQHTNLLQVHSNSMYL